MEVVNLTVFVSLGLVACSLLLLAFTLRSRTHEHADRLALLPLDEDRAPRAGRSEPGVESAARSGSGNEGTRGS